MVQPPPVSLVPALSHDTRQARQSQAIYKVVQIRKLWTLPNALLL
ncbi:MAG: hypothetical protein RMY34_18000 [Aulosira sp. DedQUE10]|nr:hypothetical protein [Aulosira sp. DedQUE10]